MSIGTGPERRWWQERPPAPPNDLEVPTMRYALLIVDSVTARPSPEPPDPVAAAQLMEEYDAYTRMLRDRGFYLGGEALQPNPTATTVRVEDGKTIITDGPFIEAKEALGGFYLIEARDLDEALELAAACPGAKSGAIEVRPVWDFDAPDAAAVGEGAGAAEPA
jgi:hypothetical protein